MNRHRNVSWMEDGVRTFGSFVRRTGDQVVVRRPGGRTHYLAPREVTFEMD